MVRTQIQLTEEQSRALRALAREERVSVAELIRRFVDVSLCKFDKEEKERKRRAIAVIGFLKTGPHDLAENHDRYLAEAYAE